MGLRFGLRQSHRLRDYDYTLDGVYVVTIVTQNRALLFGEVGDRETHYSDAGLVIDSWWHSIERRFPTVLIDQYVLMPNHLHGILFIGGQAEDDSAGEGDHAGSPLQNRKPDNPSLGAIIGWFKTMTTNDYIRGVKEDGWPPFRGKLWQRNYYDHVIRSDRALDHIRTYITNNPAQWAENDEYPGNL